MFSVEIANREPSVAIDVASKNKGLFVIPGISEVKEYGAKNNLPYSIPRFVGLPYYYICTRYIKKKKENWVTQINPLLLSTEGLVFVEETQHGVEGVYLVPRHPRILVAYTEAGTLNPVQRELIGLASLQFQQALHAVNGLFISDFGLRVDNNEEYQKANDEEKQEIAMNYFKALKEDFEEETKDDKEVQDYIKASQFVAEKVELDNAREGVLPEAVQKELDKLDGE